MDGSEAGVTIATLTHDLVARRSLVTLVWDGVPDKRITLPVPYGCGLDTVTAAAEAALRAFTADLAAVRVRTLPDG